MWDIINKIIIIIGIPSIIGGCIYIGRKLQILDDLKEDVNNLDKLSKCSTNAIVEIQTHLSGKGFAINHTLAYSANSPIQLTDYGEMLMKESGFTDIIKNQEKRDYLVKLVKDKNPTTNYDIQDYSMNTMKELAQKNDTVVVPLKEYAFKEGLTLEIILNSAGIVLRDEVMKELQFNDKF